MQGKKVLEGGTVNIKRNENQKIYFSCGIQGET